MFRNNGKTEWLKMDHFGEYLVGKGSWLKGSEFYIWNKFDEIDEKGKGMSKKNSFD